MRWTSIFWAVGALAIAAVGTTPATAVTISFQDGVSPTAAYTGTADVFIRSDQTTTTQAAIANDLLVGKNGTTIFRALIGFDLTALKNVVAPEGQKIQIDTVTLTLTHGGSPSGNNGGTSDSINLTLASYAYTFSEANAPWGTPGTGAPAGGSPASGEALSTTGAFDPTLGANVKGTVVLGTTDDFETAISNVLSTDSAVFNGILYSPGAEAGGSSSFARVMSSDYNYGTTSVRPLLTVNYSFVPMPEPAGLSAVMVLGVLLGRRRVVRGS